MEGSETMNLNYQSLNNLLKYSANFIIHVDQQIYIYSTLKKDRHNLTLIFIRLGLGMQQFYCVGVIVDILV